MERPCQKLTVADLERCLDEYSPRERGRMTKLNLSSNELVGSLPSSLSTLTALETAILSFNRLAGEVPAHLFPAQLTRLLLVGNSFTCVPESISKLTGLTELSLQKNNIREVASGIGALTSLTSLDLSFNAIKVLPFSICRLNGITRLNLEQNQLSTLPWDIDRLSRLTVLRLAGNKLGPGFASNESGADNVYALLVRMMAPQACQKAVFQLWCVYRLRKKDIGAFGDIPKDVMKIISRKLLKSASDKVWLSAKTRK
jgi:hypothetical protein